MRQLQAEQEDDEMEFQGATFRKPDKEYKKANNNYTERKYLFRIPIGCSMEENFLFSSMSNGRR